MKELFVMGGVHFMTALTILFLISIVWITYHFIVAYISDQVDKSEFLRKMSDGKSMGLFALTFGIFCQMIGFSAMFSSIEEELATRSVIRPEIIYPAIKLTMIIMIYGSLIYLFSHLLWFVASLLIEQKQTKLASA